MRPPYCAGGRMTAGFRAPPSHLKRLVVRALCLPQLSGKAKVGRFHVGVKCSRRLVDTSFAALQRHSAGVPLTQGPTRRPADRSIRLAPVLRMGGA